MCFTCAFYSSLFLTFVLSIYYVEHLYRQHRGWFGKRRLRRCFRLHVRRTRLRPNRVLVAAKCILANNPQLFYAGSSGWRLQYRRLELPMGRGRDFRIKSVANCSGRLSDTFLSSSQQLSGICGFHENLERWTIIAKQLSRISGTLFHRSSSVLFFDDYLTNFFILNFLD